VLHEVGESGWIHRASSRPPVGGIGRLLGMEPLAPESASTMATEEGCDRASTPYMLLPNADPERSRELADPA
jgi:hypothetical protein